jgi:hypothetical protein
MAVLSVATVNRHPRLDLDSRTEGPAASPGALATLQQPSGQDPDPERPGRKGRGSACLGKKSDPVGRRSHRSILDPTAGYMKAIAGK